MAEKTVEEKKLDSDKGKTIELLQFPEDLGNRAMAILFKEYDFKNTTLSTPIERIKESLLLPIPENLFEATSIRVGSNDLGLSGNAARQSSDKILDKIKAGEDISTSSEILDIIYDSKRGISGTALAAAIRHSISSTPGLSNIQPAIESGIGYTYNPYAALSFSGMDLRTFSFNWSFAPKSRKEANDLKKIIWTIKKATHPEYAPLVKDKSRAFLQYPDVCHIKFLPDDISNLLKLKPCMVSNFQFDYSGGGENAFLEGGIPAVIKFTMTLSEMEIWTKEDFKESNLEDKPDVRSAQHYYVT